MYWKKKYDINWPEKKNLNKKKKRYFLFCATDVFTNRSFLECQRRVSISLGERYMYLLSHGYYCNDAFYLTFI